MEYLIFPFLFVLDDDIPSLPPRAVKRWKPTGNRMDDERIFGSPFPLIFIAEETMTCPFSG